MSGLHDALARLVEEQCDCGEEDCTESAWRILLTELLAEHPDDAEPTAAERTVTRFDSYSQEQHQAGLAAARERLTARRASAAADHDATPRSVAGGHYHDEWMPPGDHCEQCRSATEQPGLETEQPGLETEQAALATALASSDDSVDERYCHHVADVLLHSDWLRDHDAALASRASAAALHGLADALDDHTDCDCEDGDHLTRLIGAKAIRLRANPAPTSR